MLILLLTQASPDKLQINYQLFSYEQATNADNLILLILFHVKHTSCPSVYLPHNQHVAIHSLSQADICNPHSLLAHNRITACLLLFVIEAGDFLDSVK